MILIQANKLKVTTFGAQISLDLYHGDGDLFGYYTLFPSQLDKLIAQLQEARNNLYLETHPEGL